MAFTAVHFTFSFPRLDSWGAFPLPSHEAMMPFPATKYGPLRGDQIMA
jgi:hypothetical protein